MKLLIVLSVIFLSSTLYGQGGWILQQSGTTINLRSISSFDGVNVLAVGEGGIILLSTNYGVRWRELPSPTHETLNGVAALSGKDYCIVGPKDTIFYTSDRGITWLSAKSNARGECATHSFIHELTAIDYDTITHTLCAAGNQGEVIFSSDSGRHWGENNAVPSPLALPPLPNTPSEAIDFIAASIHDGLTFVAGNTTSTQVVISHYNFFYSSADDGDDWREHSIERYNPNLAGDILLNINGCNLTCWTMVGEAYGSYGQSGTIFHSINKGATWDSIPYGSLPILHSVSFGNFVYGYLCGDNGFIMGTNDGGYNWRKQISPTTVNLRSIHFSDPFHGFSCGDSGVIITTQDGGFFDKVRAGGNSAILLQLYPNPASQHASISIYLPERGLVKVRIYNLLGNEIANLADDMMDAGSYRFEWNASETPSGIYICRVEWNGEIISSTICVGK